MTTAVRSYADLVAEAVARVPLQGVAAAVVRDGAVEWQSCVGLADASSGRPVEPSTLFAIASITKTMTALVLLAERAAGRLDLDAPVNDVLQGVQLRGRVDWPAVTARHLLTHTSGLSDVGRVIDMLRPWASSAPPASATDVPAHSQLLPAKLEPRLAPGRKFCYSNTGFRVAGKLAEDSSGRAFPELVRDVVLEPAGMRTAVYGPSTSAQMATGYNRADAGLVPADVVDEMGADGAVRASLDDLIAYAKALLGHGSLPADRVADAFSVHHEVDGVDAQGLSFVRGNAGADLVVGHGGNTDGFASYLLLAPQRGTAAVVLANTATYLGAAALCRELMDAALGLPSPTARPAEAIAADLARRLVGRYRPERGLLTNTMAYGAFGGQATISSRRDQLWLRGRRIGLVRQPVELWPVSGREDTVRMVYDATPLDLQMTSRGFVIRMLNLALHRN